MNKPEFMVYAPSALIFPINLTKRINRSALIMCTINMTNQRAINNIFLLRIYSTKSVNVENNRA